MGEAISHKLDYQPSKFTVEQHIRGKWACPRCETITQASMPAQLSDKGLVTTGLLDNVLINKCQDHLPFYRQDILWTLAE